MKNGSPLIQIVEDDAAVAESLEAILETWGFVSEIYADAEQFLAAGNTERAACVLLDVRLPGTDGLTLLGKLRAIDVSTPAIVLSGHGDVEMATQAMRLGAQDFIEKPVDDEELVDRIKSAVARNDTASHLRTQFARLTPRESDVMREVVAGHSNKMIARRLGMSPKTVEVHRARVMEKTGAESLPHLVRMALKAGLDPDSEHA